MNKILLKSIAQSLNDKSLSKATIYQLCECVEQYDDIREFLGHPLVNSKSKIMSTLPVEEMKEYRQRVLGLVITLKFLDSKFHFDNKKTSSKNRKPLGATGATIKKDTTTTELNH